MDAVKTAGFSGGYLELGGPDAPQWRVTADGWDEGRVKYLVRGWSSLDRIPYFEAGEQHARYPQMVAVDVDWSEIGNSEWEASVLYRGLMRLGLTEKPYKRQIYNMTQTQSGNNIASDAWSGGQKAEIKQGLITVRDQYVATTRPSTSAIGGALTPPEAPTTPSNWWSFLTDAIYVYPPGWVLESREIDELIGSDTCFVVDTYVYYHAVKPGDI